MSRTKPRTKPRTLPRPRRALALSGRRAAGPLAALLLGLALAATPAAAGPSWTTGYGQGTAQAGVTGSAGTEFYVACSAGTETPLAVLFFVAPQPLAGEVGQHYLVEFRIDDKTMTLVMALTQPTVLEYGGVEKTTFRALETVTRLLRAGKAATVASPQLTWEESFPLKGSGKALDGIYDGCEPAN